MDTTTGSMRLSFFAIWTTVGESRDLGRVKRGFSCGLKLFRISGCAGDPQFQNQKTEG